MDFFFLFVFLVVKLLLNKKIFLNFFIVGGLEWILEDIVELKNVIIFDFKAEIDMDCIFSLVGIKLLRFTEELDIFKGMFFSFFLVNIIRVVLILSLSIICSVRRSIVEYGNMVGIFY